MTVDQLTEDQRDALTATATGSIKIVEPTVAGALDFTPMKKAVVKLNHVSLIEGTEWTAATSAAATATSLAGAITTATATTLCTAAVDETDDSLVVITANAAGAAGNDIHMTAFQPGYTVPSGFTLSGGQTPEAGRLIYNSDTGKLNVYTTAWEEVTSAVPS